MTEPTTKPYSGSLIQGSWYKSAQAFDQRQSKNTALPRWLRVAHYCYGYMRPGGRCPTSRTALANAMGVDPLNIAREVKKAVQHGYLAEGSTCECLIAPPYEVEFTKGKAPQ